MQTKLNDRMIYLASLRMVNGLPELVLGPNGTEISGCSVMLQPQGQNGLWYGTDVVDGRHRKAAWRLSIVPDGLAPRPYHHDATVLGFLNNQLEHQDRLERTQRLLEDVRYFKDANQNLRFTNRFLLLCLLMSQAAIVYFAVWGKA